MTAKRIMTAGPNIYSGATHGYTRKRGVREVLLPPSLVESLSCYSCADVRPLAESSRFGVESVVAKDVSTRGPEEPRDPADPMLWMKHVSTRGPEEPQDPAS